MDSHWHGYPISSHRSTSWIWPYSSTSAYSEQTSSTVCYLRQRWMICSSSTSAQMMLNLSQNQQMKFMAAPSHGQTWRSSQSATSLLVGRISKFLHFLAPLTCLSSHHFSFKAIIIIPSPNVIIHKYSSYINPLIFYLNNGEANFA